MNDAILDEAIKYFRKHPVLLKLVRGFGQKYRSLGHFGGVVELSGLTEQEQRDLSVFLRRDTKLNERVSFREVVATWQKTKFDGLELERVIFSLLPEGFVSKREERQKQQANRQAVLERLSQEHTSELAVRWLQALENGHIRLGSKELCNNEELLNIVANGLDNITDDYERLPVFANKVAGNPHAFDFDQPAGRLLLKALSYCSHMTVPMAADERTSLLYKYHIIRDDILNFATVYGLAAYARNGAEIAYWREAARTFSPLNIPLREIVLAHRIVPVEDTARVYIVENSGVFSALLDKLAANQKVVPLVALHGQLKAASWALLDRLNQSGAKLLYAGDMDPEGISIANHILSRYDNAELWHMSVAEYKRAVTSLPDSRLSKMPGEVHPHLVPLVQEMEKCKKVLYQESLLDRLEEIAQS